MGYWRNKQRDIIIAVPETPEMTFHYFETFRAGAYQPFQNEASPGFSIGFTA
jgi:hypothetical protein